jgi:Tfp pilus assembly protein PilF
VTALFAVWLSGYRTGIIVMFLFAVSPTFMGHAQNNLKDIPFALSYIAATFLTLKLLISWGKIAVTDVLLLILSIGFSIGIRAGGLLLICYLFFFFLMIVIYERFVDDKFNFNENGKKLIIIILISGTAYFLSIILWPFALQQPFKNVITSYHVMAHFPDTFRQIFEGKAEWSDLMPWYYLPKSMVITIPVIVLAGSVILIFFSKKIIYSGKALIYALIIFTVLFPISFAIAGKSNVYSSWRQFLFVYPAIIIVSASGFNCLFDLLKSRYSKWLLFTGLGLLSVHPAGFMAENPSYYYLYYNQLVGGLKGANGNYETDYYYTGQAEASEWLISYLDEKQIDGTIVRATFSVEWQFRNHPGIKTFYFRNEERSQYDWDFAIITNRYIPPFRLKDGTWPPSNAIHTIYADSVPVCTVLQRKTKADYYGYKALNEGRIKEAISLYDDALKIDDTDEMIFYNFARALNSNGKYLKADSVLKKGLEINPDFEPILMYLGNIARDRGNAEDSMHYYEEVLRVNRKSFKAYVELSQLLEEKDMQKARQLLRTCLTINPKYRPAIIALAETYQASDPEIAEKYFKMADTVK